MHAWFTSLAFAKFRLTDQTTFTILGRRVLLSSKLFLLSSKLSLLSSKLSFCRRSCLFCRSCLSCLSFLSCLSVLAGFSACFQCVTHRCRSTRGGYSSFLPCVSVAKEKSATSTWPRSAGSCASWQIVHLLRHNHHTMKSRQASEWRFRF